MEHDGKIETRWAYGVGAVAAAIGTVFGAVAYLGTETGVDGTTGALLALAGAIAVTVGAGVGLLSPLGGWRIALNVLLILGAMLTAFAAWMLMQYGFAAAMAASLLALAIAATARRRRRTV